ncbi:MAG: SMC-Scp complex subunit ScpB [Deinococcaceae bacterium]
MSDFRILSAALLASGRPLNDSDLAHILKLKPNDVPKKVEAFKQHLETLDLGFTLETIAGGYRLIVDPQLTEALAPVLAPPAPSPLSRAALEVLAIVAYRGPVTRAEIEAMRGASSSALVTLQEREWVKVVGKKDTLGQPLLYATTQKFLIDFGLNSTEDLPDTESKGFSNILRN